MMTDTKKNLYLLDAYALIYRAYYAFIRAPRINSKGLNTSAIYGFTNTLLDIINNQHPTHLAVVIDYPGPGFRDELYPDYKANREAAPEDIKRAVPYIERILEAMNISMLQAEGYEADDLIGTLATRASKEGFMTYMVTSDKDFGQLVKENVKILKPRTGTRDTEIWGPEEVKSHYNVPDPINIIDLLALWGDSADNVPGCPGIGEKRAMEIIGKYGTVENVYKNIGDFKGKVQSNLIEFKDQVELARTLVTIVTDVPFEVDLDSLALKSPDMEKLRAIMEELEFKALMDRLASVPKPKPSFSAQGSLFGEEELQAVTVSDNFNTVDDIEHDYRLIEGEEEIDGLVKQLLAIDSFCFDTETTGLDVRESSLLGMSFCFEEGKACYVALPGSRNDVLVILEKFRPVFEKEGVEKIGHNIKFDALMLRQYGIELRGPYFDTMVAHHLLFPGQRHNMDYLAEVYLKYRPIPIESLIGERGKNQGNMRDVPVDKVTVYASEDADVTFRLKKIFQKELEKEGLLGFFRNVEMPLSAVLADMEYNGVSLNVDDLIESGKELEKRLAELEAEIMGMAGREFNVNSPRQVGEILFDVLKIDSKASKTKSGQYSTNEENLQKLRDKHTIINKILEQRGLKKLLSTYVETLPTMVDKKTGRLHTTYNQALVVTGRLSSINPNLQNIPIRDDEGREIRRAFTASDSNHVFLSADYSQVELRLMAHLSGDTELVNAFLRGEDIHTATASKIFKVSTDEVTSAMRRKAKTANFGIIYGISAFGLSERLNIPRSESKAIIDGYFDSFKGVKDYMEECIRMAREKGYVSTIFGRRRYLPDINSKNAVVRGVAERNAINAPIQGTAADLIKMAMVDIHKKLKEGRYKTRMILQVHDELNFDVPVEELDAVKALVKSSMESVCKLKVPLIVDLGVGNNWLEAH